MRLASLAILVAFGSTAFAKDAPTITWKKTVLDKKFRSEGVAIADVNKDGKMDVLVGEYWYEAPDWKLHEMQKPGNYGDGLGGYSKVFACWAEDLNGDGFPDLIVVGFPGEPAYWLENPKGKGTAEDGKPTHWAKHEIWHSACNETPLYQDLLGDGKKVLVMGYQPKGKKTDGNEGLMAYFTPDPKDANATWIAHPLSDPDMKGAAAGSNRFSHGLGIGDLNGDKKMDVMVGGGWYEQPSKVDGTTPWKFHKSEFTDSYSDMYAFDADGDGAADVLCTSAHKYGIWWYKQRPGKDGGDSGFEKKEIFKDLLSETHAAHFQDIDGDGQKDLITGKRWWSHGKGEPGSDKPAMIYWFKVGKGKDGIATFTPNTIDDDSGIGTQFVVQDMNGDGFLDVVVSNKKGISVILQARK